MLLINKINTHTHIYGMVYLAVLTISMSTLLLYSCLSVYLYNFSIFHCHDCCYGGYGGNDGYCLLRDY